jgi:hypothetical protein
MLVLNWKYIINYYTGWLIIDIIRNQPYKIVYDIGKRTELQIYEWNHAKCKI